MEDSGIDSDSKTNSCNGGDRPQQDAPVPVMKLDGGEADMNEAEAAQDKPQEAPLEEPQKTPQEQAASKSRALQLHRRLERHIQQSKKIRQQTRNACIDTQPKKMLLPRSSGAFPESNDDFSKNKNYAPPSDSDDSDSTEASGDDDGSRDSTTFDTQGNNMLRVVSHTAQMLVKELKMDCLLPVPNKGQGSTAQPSGDTEPLVTWKSDSEEDFEFQPTSKAAAREITQQLIKDGYDLDLTPDDDDLDLIPPKPLTQRCSCCNPSLTCSIM